MKRLALYWRKYEAVLRPSEIHREDYYRIRSEGRKTLAGMLWGYDDHFTGSILEGFLMPTYHFRSLSEARTYLDKHFGITRSEENPAPHELKEIIERLEVEMKQ